MKGVIKSAVGAGHTQNSRDARSAARWASTQRGSAAMKKTQAMFGWYDDAEQIIPRHEPGFDVPCPHCRVRVGRHAERPIKTISLHRPGDPRSYFYRAHKDCHERASDDAIRDIESVVIDGTH